MIFLELSEVVSGLPFRVVVELGAELGGECVDPGDEGDSGGEENELELLSASEFCGSVIFFFFMVS